MNNPATQTSNPVTPTPELKPNEVQAFKDGKLNLNWRDYLPLGPDGKPIKFDDVPACCSCIREELAEMEGIETDGNGQRVKRGLFSGLFGGLSGKKPTADTLPETMPWLANIARKPWHEIVFTIVLATSGGAFVAGVLLPTVEEVAQGKITAIPYTLWGAALWLACAGWLKSRNWPPFVWFTSIIFIIASWV